MSAVATRIRALSLLATLLLAACFTPPRRPAPPVVVSQLAPVGFPATVRFLGIDRDLFLARADEIERRLRAAAGGGAVNILALSGGGAGGAFGAGALVGLTHRGDRPHFHVVTGVSAGALIAPFAFLGPDWDAELTDAFGTDRAAHLLRSRGLALLFGPGVYRRKPLVELVNHFVTDRLVRAVAEQAARGGALLVATTDLDKQEPVIWDLGAIAMHGGDAARVLFRDVLVASASIPGLFPPVLIRVEGAGGPYDEMHVDGGTTLPFFVAAEIAQIVPREFEALRGARVFVLVNGQLNARPQTTRASTIAVLSRSFSAGLLQSSRKQLELSAAFAQRHAMQLRFSYIPASYPFQGPFGFKPPAMRELFTYAARCSAAGRLWLSLDQAVDQEARAATTPRKESDACPVATEAASPEH